MNKILVITLFGLLTACGAEEDKGEEQVVVDKRVDIFEDAYYAAKFTLNGDADVKVQADVVSGVSVESYFLSQEGYDVWLTAVGNQQLSDANFTYYQEFSRQPLATSFISGWHRVSAGTYYLLVENTDYGITAPPFNGVDDITTVEIKIDVKR